METAAIPSRVLDLSKIPLSEITRGRFTDQLLMPGETSEPPLPVAAFQASL